MKIKVILHEADEGGYWAEVPDLPGCATQGETFLFLVDYGLAGTLNWGYEGRHYVVETIQKLTRKILRITEPSNSTFFSLVYLLSPLPLFIPDVIRFLRKRRP